MYNIDRPYLIFDGPCHLPFTNSFYGWGFNLYEWNADKPRGLFFSHISEAVMFARGVGAMFAMDPRAAPDRVTALEYVLSRQDESDYPVAPEDGRSRNNKSPAQLEQAVRQLATMHGFDEAKIQEILSDIPTDADNLEAETEGSYGMDWTGSSTHYAGGRARPHLGADESPAGAGLEVADALDWFGDE
jgi:hypothetical protein